MRLRIVSLLSLACASTLLVTGCNHSIVSTTSGTPGGDGASYVFATNYNPTTQEGTIQSFPLTQLGTGLSAVTPASTIAYSGQVLTIACSPCGSGYTVAPIITIAPPVTTPAKGGTTATAVATLNSAGGIATVTITNPGSGYTAVPLVTVPPPPAGAAAPGLTATVTSSTLTNAFLPATTYAGTGIPTPTYLNAETYDTRLTMNSVGDGRIYYASYPASLPNVVSVHEAYAPNPSIIEAANGSVTALSLTTAGAGYTSVPAVTIAAPTAPNGIQATAAATLSSSTGPVSAVTVTANGSGYTTATVTFSAPTTVGGTTATGTAAVASGAVTGITLTSPGSGYVTAPIITITGDGSGAAATAAVAAPYGAIAGLTITNPGSGYTTATPAVSIAPPPSASATAVINSSGVVTAINVDNGGIGYTAVPGVTLSAPSSATATATATFNAAGQITGLVLTNPGFGYTSPPAVTIPAQAYPSAGAAATATLTSGAVTAVTMTATGGGYLTAPTVTFSAPGINATATSAITSGAVSGVTITNGGAGYTSTPTVTFAAAPITGTTATGTATLTNGVVTGITITSAGSGYTAAPAVTISATPTTGTTATGTTVISSSQGGIITGVNIANPGSGYVGAPTISFSTPATSGAAIATATISTSGTTKGQVTGFTVLIGGSGYTSTPTVTVAGPAAAATATATATINSSGTIPPGGITVTSGGSGYLAAPTVTIAGNGAVQAVATATATGAVSIGALTAASRVLTDALASNFMSLAADRSAVTGNIYVSEANGHMIVIPSTAAGSGSCTGCIPVNNAGATVSPNTAVVDFDMSTDAGGTGSSTINPTGIGASNTGFSIMTTDLDENLYTYVAGSGVITEYAYNDTYNFPPYTNPANVCPIGTSQCLIGSTAVTSPPIFPTALLTYTLPSSVTNVVDIVTDLYGNLFVLAQNGGPGQATVTEYAPCTATCSPSPIKTIGGANTGFNIPGSIAVDTIGNVYVEDFSVTSPTLNDFSVFTVNQSGNVAPNLSFTETVPNTAPGGGTPSGYGLAVY